jgi:HEAT repeat protein
MVRSLIENINHYEVLGLQPDASFKDIKYAYRDLAIKYHPDVCKAPTCVNKFREITEAYEVLNDKNKRATYDSEYTIRSEFYQKNRSTNSPEQIIIFLINNLNAPESYVRNAAVDELVKIGKLAFNYVSTATRSPNEVIRRKACDILGRMDDPRGIGPLIRLLSDSDAYVRRRAANALINLNDEKAVLPLINALKDYESKVRARSAEALGNIKDERAVKPLITSLKDKRSRVRYASVVALGKIGDTSAVKPIQALINDYKPDVRLIVQKTLEDKFNIKKETYTTNNNTRRETNQNNNNDGTESIIDVGKDIINEIDGLFNSFTSNPNKSPPKARNTSPPRNKKPSNICPHCSNPINPNTNFCAKCGNKITQNTKPESMICPSCDKKNDTKAKFCSSCGYSFKTSSTNNNQNLEDLEKLADLKDKGIITEEEFQAKKRQILGL